MLSSHSIHALFLAARPKTLPAAIIPVLLGAAVAARIVPVDLLLFAAILGSAICIQIGTNFANDYADFKSGADDERRLGPTRVTQAGLLTPAAVKVGANISFALAVVFGIPLMMKGGLPIVAIGLASILCGWLYTSGPYPLGYNGLGEIFVILFFGFAAVMGTAYLLASVWSREAALVAIAPACHASALLAANNLRDMETDHATGKHTLAVRFGRSFAKYEFTALMLLPFLIPFILFGFEGASAIVLLPVLALPLAVRAVRIAAKSRMGAEVIPAFRETPRVMLVFGALFIAGLMMS